VDTPGLDRYRSRGLDHPTRHERKTGYVPFQVIPRELVFYDLLDRAAHNVAEGSGELLALVDDLRHAPEHAARIRDLEHAGDELTHEIIATLNTTFVVPIDRHDILRLAQALDDVLDHQQGVADLIELLPVEDPFPWFRKQVETLARTCGAMVRAVGHLRQIRSVPPDVAAIKREEREGDWIYRRAVADLYSGDYKPLEVLMWRDLLEQVEAAVDRCEDVANQIESVVAKFA
jgi:predicted phosphate transport protein (TIGR00153 family)